MIRLGLRLWLLGLVVLGSVIVVEATPRVAADQSTEHPLSISMSWPSGVKAFLRVESSRPVFNVLYHYGRVRSAANGAYGPNVTARQSAWYLEYQRAGATDVIAGVLHRDGSLVAAGLRMFHFGLTREASNGSFPGSAWPFHGTAMFLAEAAPALIVLRYSPMGARFSTELRWDTTRMRRAVYWMAHVVHGAGKIDDSTKNHRFYEAAIAFGAVGVLAGDRELQAWSARYVRRGIAMERPDGVMPEDGGHDTSYQALGMMHATRYLELLATGPLHHALYAALRRGEKWELSRVRANGTINQAGDTRTTGCQERNPLGTCKTANYIQVASALMRWSVIGRDARYERAAYMAWLQNWQLVPGDVLPPPGLWASPQKVQSGQWLTVWGTRYKPLERVGVYFDGKLMATVSTDQIGSFGGHSPEPNAHFPIPPTSAGDYVVSARGSLGTVRTTEVVVQG